jgi:hypothetical protein
MQKIKYYQLAFKDGEVKKLTSPSRTELETLTADGWTLQGYDNAADIPANPTLDNGTVREMTQTEIEASETAAKLARNVFTQLEIREAFKALDKEADLDALLNGNAEFKNYWTEAQEIRLNHPVTVQALANFTEAEINALKMEI